MLNELSEMWFDGWIDIARLTFSVPVMYLAIVGFIRLSGKRSTSQMNNFDWIVTVAMGSIAAAGMTLDSITLSEALFAVALLLTSQWIMTFIIARTEWLGRVVKAEPRLLVHEGRALHDAMRDERVTMAEVMAAVRGSGLAELKDIQWLILETDATLSVIPKGERDFSNVEIDDVMGYPPEA